MKKKVLILAGYYLPGVKGGGPVQSISNLVKNLSEDIDFYILANDRDFGDTEPYSDVIRNKWVNVNNSNVFYTDIKKLDLTKLARIINSIQADILYLNSFFSIKLSIIPYFLFHFKRLNVGKVIIAPRGNFSEGAMNLKSDKKDFFIKLIRKIGLYKDVVWHATADTEKKEILNYFPINRGIHVCSNLISLPSYSEFDSKKNKDSGTLSIIFISRIHPKKNLRDAISYLKHITGNITFNIYGPIEDENYWKECKNEIKLLPVNVMVNYHGTIQHHEIFKALYNNHVFLFPTYGENFGHVIFEALASGCPVIISDQTPWRNLEALEIGNDISLTKKNLFINSIQKYVDMDEPQFNRMSQNSIEYALNQAKEFNDITPYQKMFTK